MNKKDDIKKPRVRARIEAKVRIQILGHDEYEQIYTGDISKSGMFLESSQVSVKKGQKLEMNISIPDSDNPIRVTGKVIRIIGPNQLKETPGVAFEFVKIESRRSREFDRFLEQLIDAKGLGCRKFPRADTEIPVELHETQKSYDALTKNISKGGLFVKTPAGHFTIGDRVQVVLIHPTSKRKFTIPAEIVHIRMGSKPTLPEFEEGLGIEFFELSEIRRQDLSRFLKSVVSSKKKNKK
ncbi:MAG: PilZ domain-containing protein [Bdellovibrionales bacterium]|nr:PilZ domain-containing protein [Bdellovibrionales bacterium]